MGLLERLQQAKQERAGAAGVEVDIDLTQVETVNRFGYPTSCPECGGAGYLDHLDLVGRTQEQHCVVCRHEWTVSESELDVEV